MFVNKLNFSMLFKKASSKLILITFFISLGLGVLDSIFSIYLESIFGNPATVGFISGFLVFLMLLTYLYLTQMYSKYKVTQVWFFSTIALAFSLFALYFFKSIFLVLIFLIIFEISLALHYNATPILLYNSTTLANLGQVEGKYYTFRNLGWVVGPLLGSIILLEFGLVTNFIFVFIFIFIGWFLFTYFEIRSFEENESPVVTIKSIHQNIFTFFKNKDLVYIYLLKGGLSFYWGLIYVFTPLFIIEHLPIYYVGVFLFILAIPVVLLEHMVGKYVDTNSVRPVFIIGFFLMSFFTLLAYIFSNIYVTLFFLFLSVLGATFVEPTVEYYFFKVIHKNEVNKKYGVYRTSDSLFSLFCRFSCALLLLFFTLKELYLYAGIILSLFLFVAVKVID